MSSEIKLPLLPIRSSSCVVFPHAFADVIVGRKFSMDAVNVARENGLNIVVAFQKNSNVDEPKFEDLYTISTIAEIKDIIPANEGMRVILEGRTRAWLRGAAILKDKNNVKIIQGTVEKVVDPDFDLDEVLVDQIRQIKEIVNQYFKSVIIKYDKIKTPNDVSRFIDNIAGQLNEPFFDKKKLISVLRLKDPKKRVERVLEALQNKLSNTPVEILSGSGAADDISMSGNPAANEIRRLHDAVSKANMSKEAEKIAFQEIRRLGMMAPNNSEFQVTFNYVETLLSLPWNKRTSSEVDIETARKILDEDHYGLKTAKERILEFMAVRKLAPEKKGSILCFNGPSGCGKTSICRSIAKAMGRKFIRLSLGGVHDEAEIRGHRRTYVGALPGKIIQMLKRMDVKNPIFALDELDKVSKNFRGDPGSALLEVLDPEQNKAFMDNYIAVPFDLSEIIFIATTNDVSSIPSALKDRLEVIEISGYSTFDKIKIAQNYLVEKQRKENGLSKYEVSISSEALNRMVEEYTCEAGVRSLERKCGAVMRKLAVMVAAGQTPPSTINEKMVPDLLGPPKEFEERAAEEPEVGVSTGLAWSSNGGSLLFVECSLSSGKGKVSLTGNLGKVIQESAQAAFTYIKSNAETFNIDPEIFSKRDVHVHFPAGAIPKDGPSAGVALLTAMLSCFLQRPVRHDIAMTGEISLRGKVMPIGGLREKALAAHRAGIKTVIFPKNNQYDLDEIPEDVKKEIKLIPISYVAEAIELLIVPNDPVEIVKEEVVN